MRKYLIGLAAIGALMLCGAAWAAWTTTTEGAGGGRVAATWTPGGVDALTPPTITEQGPSPSCSSVTDVSADERPKPDEIQPDDPCWILEDDTDGRPVVVPRPLHEEVIPNS